MSEDKDLEVAVAMYREQLQAEADIGRAALDEIEDHLRSLIAELRDGGMPLAEATRAAAERLGDPAAIAIEHTRVRTSFGAKLPAWRARIAAAAIVLQMVAVMMGPGQFVTGPLQLFEMAVACGMAIALALGLTWPRPVLLAAMLWQLAWGLLDAWPMTAFATGVTPMSAIAFAMLVPWSRREFRAPAWALAALYFSYLGCAWLGSVHFMARDGGSSQAPLAAYAMFGVIAAAVGVVLRARWAAMIAGAIAVVQMVGLGWLVMLGWAQGTEMLQLITTGTVALGAVCAAFATVVAWRTARSGLGTLRDVLA